MKRSKPDHHNQPAINPPAALDAPCAAADSNGTPDAEATFPPEATAFRFRGKTALVTGASDRGIGGAIAELLAREGATLALLSRDEPKRLVKRLKRLDQPISWRHCDVTDGQQVSQSVAAVVAQVGKLDILVNNAGIEVARPLVDFADDEWRKLLEVNLHGAIDMTRAALPHMTEPGGVIVNVASALALGGCTTFSVYSASKAGLVGFTQSAAWELAPRGIRVVAVAPGLVHTPMAHKYLSRMTPAERQRFEASVPLGIGMPQDVAAAVAFLASRDARWITGVTLPLGWAPSYALPVAPLMT
jgi:NAD(P)-dependent dehydrogenase (short-subunit alcohol dehydrogenase family)